MQMNPYLLFNGQCEAAFKTYAECLGGKIEAMIPHAGTPAEQQVPAEWRNKILHARLTVGNEVLMGSDAPPGRYEEPKASLSRLRSRTRRKPTAFFARWRKTARCECPSKRPSGPSDSAC